MHLCKTALVVSSLLAGNPAMSQTEAPCEQSRFLSITGNGISRYRSQDVGYSCSTFFLLFETKVTGSIQHGGEYRVTHDPDPLFVDPTPAWKSTHFWQTNATDYDVSNVNNYYYRINNGLIPLYHEKRIIVHGVPVDPLSLIVPLHPAIPDGPSQGALPSASFIGPELTIQIVKKTIEKRRYDSKQAITNSDGNCGHCPGLTTVEEHYDSVVNSRVYVYAVPLDLGSVHVTTPATTTKITFNESARDQKPFALFCGESRSPVPGDENWIDPRSGLSDINYNYAVHSSLPAGGGLPTTQWNAGALAVYFDGGGVTTVPIGNCSAQPVGFDPNGNNDPIPVYELLQNVPDFTAGVDEPVESYVSSGTEYAEDFTPDLNNDGIVNFRDAEVIADAFAAGDRLGTESFTFNFDYNLSADIDNADELVYRDYLLQEGLWCIADTNFDGSVTPTDYGAWLELSNTGSMFADSNLDGIVIPTDYGAWLAAYGAQQGSCP